MIHVLIAFWFVGGLIGHPVGALVRNVEPAGFRVKKLGEFDLKGIAHPVTLHEAVGTAAVP